MTYIKRGIECPNCNRIFWPVSVEFLNGQMMTKCTYCDTERPFIFPKEYVLKDDSKKELYEELLQLSRKSKATD